jgi:putative endonuclease
MLTRSYAVYLMAGRPHGTLYVGVTSDLIKRIAEHRAGRVEGFTKKYGVKTLVWYELTESIESAIAREKQIKKWNRAWKIELIEKANPGWRDLYPEIVR